MISSVRGLVVHAGADQVVVEVGGVGLSVAVPTDVALAARLGDTLALHTHLVVREDALALFGFASRDELDVFQLLLGVSGVGPKSALGVLSALAVDDIATAVAAEDDAPFRRVSGIGPKTAKLIVVQLQGKLHATAPAARTPGQPTPPATLQAQVVAALVGLGWAEKVASDAVATTLDQADASMAASVPALLRATLAALGPARSAGA